MTERNYRITSDGYSGETKIYDPDGKPMSHVQKVELTFETGENCNMMKIYIPRTLVDVEIADKGTDIKEEVSSD